MGKNPAADLAKKRWEGTTEKERSALMTHAAQSRWNQKTEEERKAEGARLAEARAKKRTGGKKKAAKKAGVSAKKEPAPASLPGTGAGF